MKRIHGDPRRNYAREWKRWRKTHGLTREQMASALGITARTVAYIETKCHRPSMTSREKMAQLQKRYREAQCQPQL